MQRKILPSRSYFESFTKDSNASCSLRRRELKAQGIRSIFKVTTIFDSYSPRPWFWRHLFHDPPPSTHIYTHNTQMYISVSRLTSHTHTYERKREVESTGARLWSMSNCTMPADTPPISEHQLCSTPSLCSTLVARLRTILKSDGPRHAATISIPRLSNLRDQFSTSPEFVFFLNKTTPMHAKESHVSRKWINITDNNLIHAS